MYLIFVVVVTVCISLVKAQSPCTTPTGEEGECVPVNNCQPLLNLVNKKKPTGEEHELLKKSHCKLKEKAPAVCCPKLQAACQTPEGFAGKCISIYSCPHLSDMLNTPVSEENYNYVENSKCQSSEQYSVCCGPPPILTNVREVERGNCEAKVNAYPPDPRTYCCGEDTTDPRIKNGAEGDPTTIDEHPWTIIIEYQHQNLTKLLCGGVLISGKYVLTAAHCVTGAILNLGIPQRVLLGEYNISHEGPDSQNKAGDFLDCTDGVTTIGIEKVIPHPEYDPLDPQKRNDIAMIRLKETAPYTAFIRPICLPASDMTLPQVRPSHFPIYAVGWGAINETKPLSEVKTYADLVFEDQDNCQKAFTDYNGRKTIWKKQLCAGGTKGRNSCKVESGGPLIYQHHKQYQVIGIMSFGPIPCDLEGIPSVYSKVYEYLDWIRNTIVP